MNPEQMFRWQSRFWFKGAWVYQMMRKLGACHARYLDGLLLESFRGR